MNNQIVLTDAEKLQISLAIIKNAIQREEMRFDKANVARRINELSKQSGVATEKCKAFIHALYLGVLESLFS
jgi:hypothetical protein